MRATADAEAFEPGADPGTMLGSYMEQSTDRVMIDPAAAMHTVNRDVAISLAGVVSALALCGLGFWLLGGMEAAVLANTAQPDPLYPAFVVLLVTVPMAAVAMAVVALVRRAWVTRRIARSAQS